MDKKKSESKLCRQPIAERPRKKKKVSYSIQKLQVLYFGIKSQNLRAQHSRDNCPLGLVLDSSDQQTVEGERKREDDRGGYLRGIWKLTCRRLNKEKKRKKKKE